MNSFTEDEDTGGDSEPPTGSGGGGGMGTPSSDLDMAPSDSDQEGNEVVSGGGVAGPEEDEHSGGDENEPLDKADK